MTIDKKIQEILFMLNLDLPEFCECLRDLDQVGPNKPVGYLPKRTITLLYKIDIRHLGRRYRSKGQVVRLIPARRSFVRSGAIFVYSKAAMRPIIENYGADLRHHRWPLDPDALIRVIARRYLPLDHPMRPMIDELFADDFFRHLTWDERRHKEASWREGCSGFSPG